MGEGRAPKIGVWSWDDTKNCLLFIPKTDIQQSIKPSVTSRDTRPSGVSLGTPKSPETDLRMMDNVDAYTQMKFKKYLQRKVKFNEPDVVTIQDVKDVAIFTSYPEDLTPEFISYFHTESMDKFLRSLIIYFQYYFQVWNKMTARRVEAKRKLRQPIVTEVENVIRDNLADLRSMIARDYACILMGLGDADKYHHMNNKNNDSLSDRDRRLFEMLCFMSVKVVWIALLRKYMVLIEKEMNRMLRTSTFSSLEHKLIISILYETTPEEDRVLLGKAFHEECKLLHRSPAIQELIFDNHDYRMLAIGIKEIEPSDERTTFLEAAYAAPEELLLELGVGIGILGQERKYLDTMLKPLEISTTKKRESFLKVIEFNLPPKSEDIKWNITETLPKKPCKYQILERTRCISQQQCKMWRQYVELAAEGESVTKIFGSDEDTRSNVYDMISFKSKRSQRQEEREEE